MIVQLQATSLGFRQSSAWLFRNINFCLLSGQLMLVSGHNGSGKSSLLQLIAGLLSSHKGTISLKTNNTYSIHYKLELHEILGYRSHKLGLSLDLSVLEELKTQVSFHDKINFETLLADAGLLAKKHTLIQRLSAGQKQRLSLACLFYMQKNYGF